MHLMRHASMSTQILDEQMMLLSQVSWVGMLGTTLDYLGWIGPPAITIEVFLRNESDRTRFSKFQCKRLPRNGEEVGPPRLLFLAWKNVIFCYYCKLFSSGYPLAQHSIPIVSAGTTLVPPFWSGRYLARGEVLLRVAIFWFIVFNGAVYNGLCWRDLGVTLSGLAFVTSLISTISLRLDAPIKNFYTPLSGAPQSVSNRAPHLLKPALTTDLWYHQRQFSLFLPFYAHQSSVTHSVIEARRYERISFSQLAIDNKP